MTTLTYAPYYPGGWQDSPSTTTPIIAAALQNMEGGIGLVTAAIASLSAYMLTPTGDATGGADAAAIVNAFAAGFPRVVMGPGTWYVLAGQVILGYGQYLEMSGVGSTIVNGVGTGVVFQQTFAGTYNATIRGGSIGGPLGGTVDISSMGNGSIGVQVGNIYGLHVNAEVNDTSVRSPALIGIYLCNDIHWTEGLYLERAHVNGCTVTFDVIDGPAGTFNQTSSNSFKGIHGDIYVNQRGITANDGLVLANGALWYDGGPVKYDGNFAGGASPVTSCAVRISGTVPAGHPNAGSASAIRAMGAVVFGPECAPGTFTPQTIIFGSSANVIVDSAGMMDFSADGGLNTFTASNWTGSGSFFGPIVGDTSLAGLSRLAHPLTLDAGLSLLHGNSQALSNGATITTAGLTGILTTGVGAGVTGIIMQAGTLDGQLMVVINQSGSGSITFAASGTSNVSDGTTDAIGPQSARAYMWSRSTSLWYPVSLAGGQYIASSLLTAHGDIVYENATPAPARLAIGTAGQLLAVAGGQPAWQSLDGTATDIQAVGTQSAGSAGLPADAGHVHAGGAWLPGDNGYLAATYDPMTATAADVLVPGVVYLVRVMVRQAFTWTNVRFNINTVGAGTSAGCLVGLYSPAGTLLSGSADCGSTFTGSAGPKGVALTTPQALTPASETFVWVAFLCNLQTTQVKLSALASNSGNDNLSASVFRFAVNGPAATTVASGSNGGEISTIASWSSPSAGVLAVASTAGYPSSGSLAVAASGSTLALITYTGISGGNQFTGCAYVSGSATGTVATGGAVTAASLPASITPSSNAGAGSFAFFAAGT